MLAISNLENTVLTSLILTMVFRPSRPYLRHQRRTTLDPLSTGTFAAEQTDPMNNKQMIKTLHFSKGR